MRKTLILISLGILLPTLALASDTEITVFGGYNFGGKIDEGEVGDNNTYVRLGTKSSFSTGASVTFLPKPGFGFELYWGFRPSHLEANGRTGPKMDVATLNSHDIHANFLFSPAYSRSKFVPYFLLGLGATVLSPGNSTLEDGSQVNVGSKTKFSFALGVGAKTYFSRRFGLKGQLRYHATYINDQNGGYYCGYYGCYNTINTNWLDEWDFQAGLVLRLGS